MPDKDVPDRDKPWIFRTYAGYASPEATNARFKSNLAKGQTGLSVAFDLPTQTGYDSDHEMARGEVGKVGVPISSISDMRGVFDGIPIAEMNTSMTINATAMWLLALYVSVADEQGAERKTLAGTTQNDILKEYLSRGTHIFPPEASIRLTTDIITWTLHETPKWNPINVCSYHLQEAGADPVLEVAYALANAVTVLDAVKATGRVSEEDFPRLFGRISFFCNSGIRYIEETCKMRVFKILWERVAVERYGVTDEKAKRFRYGVQVNSLGLTAVQPENNVFRIFLEMLGVTQSKDARARAVQLPAWNEALGLPRSWDQQWSLRSQQVLAYESDLLDYGDIFEGSKVIEAKTDEIASAAWDELSKVLDMGGSVEALGYMKESLVSMHAERRRRIETGEQVVVGLNRFTETETSHLVEGLDELAFERVDPAAERAQIESVERWRSERDLAEVKTALDELKRVAETTDNLFPASIAAAHAGATTGEWADALREVFGEYRPPTGIGTASRAPDTEAMADTRAKVNAAQARLGVAKLRMLVAKPGLDGHSNAAEQVAIRARDAGFEVVYQGIRLTPAQIARAAADEDVHVIGLSILSGAHGLLVPQVLDLLRAEGVDPTAVPVVVGGVIPDEDAAKLKELGVAQVYTPKDFDLTKMIGDIADLVGQG
ncbi:MAG: ethylmalonyl-CoA mutase [Actinomycetota bacterium]|jgi:(2R)-ethylmalonyl-CoA mutase|nr:ethylmalonyl-CoA mutase [Actinomycetota bacterium]